MVIYGNLDALVQTQSWLEHFLSDSVPICLIPLILEKFCRFTIKEFDQQTLTRL